MGVWQSLREDGNAHSCSTDKLARTETRVIHTQLPAVRRHRRSARGSPGGDSAAVSRPMAHWPRRQDSRARREEDEEEVEAEDAEFFKGSDRIQRNSFKETLFV